MYIVVPISAHFMEYVVIFIAIAGVVVSFIVVAIPPPQFAYTVPTWFQITKSPVGEDWAKCLILLVPTAGFELAT